MLGNLTFSDYFQAILVYLKAQPGLLLNMILCIIYLSVCVNADGDIKPNPSEKSLIVQWLNCCTAAKSVLSTWGSIPSSWLKVDSAFYLSKVSKMSTHLAGGGAMCSLYN